LSDQTHGEGLPFQSPSEIVYDPLLQRLLVSHRSSGSIYSVDPDTGDRAIVSISVGTSLPADHIALNVATRRLYGIIRSNYMGYMDLDTGQITQFSSSFRTEQPFFYPTDFVVPGNADYIIATDDRLDAVLAISTVNGDYVVISR